MGRGQVARRAAHASFKVLTAMVVSAVGPDLLKRLALSAGLLVRRLTPGETREERADGYYVVDDRGKARRMIPRRFTWRNTFILNSTMDRCMVGGSGMNYAMGALKMLIVAHHGARHDQWNESRKAASCHTVACCGKGS